METRIKRDQPCLVDVEPEKAKPCKWVNAKMLTPNMRDDGSLVEIEGFAYFYPNKLIKRE